MKTEAKKRRDRRLYMRDYRKRQEIANGQRHPTLSNEELAAVEEVIAWEEAREYSQGRASAHKCSPVPPADAERDAKINAEIGAFALQQRPKPAEQDLESKAIRIPAPPDLPNGIIL